MRPDPLALENQLCFPLYACSREVVRLYTPYLDEIGLTYTQYITMMVLWAEPRCKVKAIGERLHLDSGTLTPVLKKLEAQGLIRRTRDLQDERNVIVELTGAGADLRARAEKIPEKVGSCIPLEPEEAKTLYSLLYQMLDNISG